MDPGEQPYKTMSPSGRPALTDPDSYIYHFPLTVMAGWRGRWCASSVLNALAGGTKEELVSGKLDYAGAGRWRRTHQAAAQFYCGEGGA